MWCSSCQQDVPGQWAGEGTRGIVCPRCAAARRSIAPAVTTPPWDDADLEADLRLAEKMIRIGAAHRRMDPNAHSAVATAPSAAAEHLPAAADSMAPTAGGASTLVWGSGMLLVVGGMAAVTYSLITHRSDLWNLGLSLALAGQAVLILGMVLRLESRARRSSSSQARVEQRPGTGREGDQGPLAAPPGTIRRVDSASLSQASLDLASVQRQLDLIAYRLQRPVPPRD